MKIKYLWLISLFLLGCQSGPLDDLQDLLVTFEKEFLITFPDYAAAMGAPQATDILILPSKSRLNRNLSFCQKFLRSFQHFEKKTHSTELEEQRIEKVEILTGMIERMTGTRSPFKNPGYYHVYPALAWRIHEIDQQPDEINFKLLLKTLRRIPPYFSHAEKNLDDPDISKTKAAINLQKKTLDYLKTTVVERIQILPENKEQANLENARKSAEAAVATYLVFCKSILYRRH